MKLFAWHCNKCKLDYSLSALPKPMCYICRIPLVRTRQSAPPPIAPRKAPPPVAPRNRSHTGGRPRGGAPAVPPKSNPERERLDAARIAGMPLCHYFNLYLPAVLQQATMPPGSKHAAYRVKLWKDKRFIEMCRGLGHNDAKDYVEKAEQVYVHFRIMLGGMDVVLRHIYNQLFDHRMYLHDSTVEGWCLGIAGFWLRQKRGGVNVFPDVIYNTPELQTANGSPVRLMINQEKLRKHHDLLSIGGKSEIPIQLKNVLDYIAGGRHAGGDPALHISHTNTSSQYQMALRQFHRSLAPQWATPEQKAVDRFVVMHCMQSGRMHMMGLDMEALEFFDPNFGVFTVANRSRNRLIEFIFDNFYPMFYRNETVRDFYIVRIE